MDDEQHVQQQAAAVVQAKVAVAAGSENMQPGGDQAAVKVQKTIVIPTSPKAGPKKTTPTAGVREIKPIPI